MSRKATGESTKMQRFFMIVFDRNHVLVDLLITQNILSTEKLDTKECYVLNVQSQITPNTKMLVIMNVLNVPILFSMGSD